MNKCLVCLKSFEVINPKSTTRRKKGRQSSPKGNFTCSPPCSRIYNALYAHFKYKLKKSLKGEKENE